MHNRFFILHIEELLMDFIIFIPFLDSFAFRGGTNIPEYSCLITSLHPGTSVVIIGRLIEADSIDFDNFPKKVKQQYLFYYIFLNIVSPSNKVYILLRIIFLRIFLSNKIYHTPAKFKVNLISSQSSLHALLIQLFLFPINLAGNISEFFIKLIFNNFL